MSDSVLFFLKDIPINITGWESKFPNLTEQQSYVDKDFEVLGAEAVNFFKSIDLEPCFGIIWSWPYKQNEKLNYHIDPVTKDGVVLGDLVSMNFLLAGDSGLTEFISIDKTKEIDSDFFTKKMNLTYRKFENTGTPDHTYILTKDRPSIMRIDVPHRVNTNNISPNQCRWSYSLRFYVNSVAADWESCLHRLSNHLILKE
jgi:hypothetical protein